MKMFKIHAKEIYVSYQQIPYSHEKPFLAVHKLKSTIIIPVHW